MINFDVLEGLNEMPKLNPFHSFNLSKAKTLQRQQSDAKSLLLQQPLHWLWCAQGSTMSAFPISIPSKQHTQGSQGSWWIWNNLNHIMNVVSCHGTLTNFLKTEFIFSIYFLEHWTAIPTAVAVAANLQICILSRRMGVSLHGCSHHKQESFWAVHLLKLWLIHSTFLPHTACWTLVFHRNIHDTSATKGPNKAAAHSAKDRFETEPNTCFPGRIENQRSTITFPHCSAFPSSAFSAAIFAASFLLACTRTGNNRLKEPSRFHMVIPPRTPRSQLYSMCLLHSHLNPAIFKAMGLMRSYLVM